MLHEVEARVIRLPARAAPIRLTLLGSFQAEDGAGRDILPRTRKARALLAILALANGAPVLRQTITSLLWSGRAQDQARGSLRQSLHELQERLHGASSDALVAERAHLALNMTHVAMDVSCFVTLDGGPDQAMRLLDNGALRENGQVLLEDLVGVDPGFTKWLDVQRTLLATNALSIADAALAAASTEHVIDQAAMAVAATRIIRLEPGRERAWQHLISAGIGMGDPDGAIRSFQRCAAALARAGMGPPSAETRALAATIRPSLRVVGTAPPPAMPDRTVVPEGVRLGVLAFRSLDTGSPHIDDAALCVGLAEEITTALGRFRGITLIASSSVSALSPAASDDKGSPVADNGAAAERLRSLRLDFVLDGTIQRRGDRVRVTARLIDLRVDDPVGKVVWSCRFDRPGSDLLAMQDEIAAETVAQVDPHLMLRAYPLDGASRTLELPTATAHELLLRAIPVLYRLDEAEFRLAGQALAQAVERSPGYAAAHAWYAYWHLFLVGQGWADAPHAAIRQAGVLADLAVSLDPTDARGLTIAGHARAFLQRNIDEAITLHSRALDLNPNLPLAWSLSGLALSYAGRHEEAVTHIQQARRLSPFDPHGFFFDMALSLPLLCLGRMSEALDASRRAAAMNPTFSSSYKGYLAALGFLAGTNAAVHRADLDLVLRHLRQLEPDFTLTSARARSPLRRAQDVDIYIEGLRRGGLPES